MRIIKTKIVRLEVNDKGFEEINKPKSNNVDREGKQSREYWENMGITPTPNNCYDYYDEEEDYVVDLDFNEHFTSYSVDFYFRAEDFKTLEVDGEESAILTLTDGSEHSIHKDNIEQLKAELEKLG